MTRIVPVQPAEGSPYSTTPTREWVNNMPETTVVVSGITSYGYKTGEKPDYIIAKKDPRTGWNLQPYEEYGPRFVAVAVFDGAQAGCDLPGGWPFAKDFADLNPEWTVIDRLTGKRAVFTKLGPVGRWPAKIVFADKYVQEATGRYPYIIVPEPHPGRIYTVLTVDGEKEMTFEKWKDMLLMEAQWREPTSRACLCGSSYEWASCPDNTQWCG